MLICTMPPILYNLIHIRLYFLNKNKYNTRTNVRASEQSERPSNEIERSEMSTYIKTKQLIYI
jgi:hypothetical protein